MHYSKYGDGGKTEFRGKMVDKNLPQLRFIASLKLLKAQIKWTLSNIDGSRFSQISKTLCAINYSLSAIIDDYSTLTTTFKVESRLQLEEEINNLSKIYKNYLNPEVSCKLASNFELLGAQTLEVELVYYSLDEVFPFQGFLNALSKYFYAVSTYFDFLAGM